MGEEALLNRRQHERYPLTTSLQFYHGPSQRDFPGRCINISSGGLMMHVPPGTPLRVGQPIKLSIGSFNRPEFAGLSEKPLDATIVRVEHDKLVSQGQLGIGVRFTGVGVA